MIMIYIELTNYILSILSNKKDNFNLKYNILLKNIIFYYIKDFIWLWNISVRDAYSINILLDFEIELKIIKLKKQ